MLDFAIQVYGPINAVSEIQQTIFSTAGTLEQLAASAASAAPAAAEAASSEAGSALATAAQAGTAGLGPAGVPNAVSAAFGKANSLGQLSVPPSWAAPSTAGTSALLGTRPLAAPTADVAESGMPGAPGMPAGMTGRDSAANFRQPRYGVRLTVITRHPAIG
jgi:hypothetical protein